MLKVENLSKQYTELLFEKVTFLLGNKEKVGLVGLNGCGKTTLLKIIAGIEKPDTGKVELVKETVGYLPQEYSFKDGFLVGEYLERLVNDPHTEMYRVERILAKLAMGDVDHYQFFKDLSEGEKMKLFLTRILLDNPSILLLDEPTNHLDIEGILHFEQFIKNFKGICIIISHDREFLNNTVDHVFEIDEQRLITFEGNYDDYLLGKQKYIEDRDKEYKFQERKRYKLDKLLLHAHKIKSAKKRGKAVKAAKKRMTREVTRKEVREYKEQLISKFVLSGSLHSKKTVIDVNNLTFGYTLRSLLIKNSSLSIYGKERVWFLGKNGIGKTTLVKLIIGQLKAGRGEIKWGSNIKWTYFSQDQSHLDMEMRVSDFIIKNTAIPFDKVYGLLEKFLFPKQMIDFRLKTLSPGQRARLSFSVFTTQPYDFLILDEPTNHLDIRTKEIIEESLADFQGSILLISHDRYFVKSIGVNRGITIEDKKIVEIPV